MGSRDLRSRPRVSGRRTLKRGTGQRVQLDPKVLFPWDMGLRESELPGAGPRFPGREGAGA